MDEIEVQVVETKSVEALLRRDLEDAEAEPRHGLAVTQVRIEGFASLAHLGGHVGSLPVRFGHYAGVASYSLNERAVARARRLIEARQYVLVSDWGDVQPRAQKQNAFLASHSWDEYAEWHLGLTDGAPDQTKARYAFVYGDFRRVHRMGLIACQYRAAEWRHKDIELAAHELLQLLDATSA